MATLKEVAKKANVSLATASYALNGDNRIKKETKEKVLKAANSLHYVPNGAARSLRIQKYNRILVFVSNFGGPIHQAILEYLYTKLKKQNYEMIVCNGASATVLLQERNYDGVINLDSTIDNEVLKSASAYNYPIIDTTRNWKDSKIISLPLRGTQPVYEIIKMAIDEGYKSFGYVHGSKDSYDDKHRFRGFIKALEERKIDSYVELFGCYTPESGYDAIKDYLNSKKSLPEVIFFANDEMAIGALDYLKRAGYDLNKVKIIGFDNINLGMYYNPGLTTISIDRDHWTTMIVGTLMDIINQRPICKYECKYEIVRRKTF